jgi:hypothetical protein
MFRPPIQGGCGVTKPGDETFTEIEETQAALRDSIAKAKKLAEESERLIRRRRRDGPEAGPSEPGPGRPPRAGSGTA